MQVVSRIRTVGSKALIEFLRDEQKNWRWRVTARNGEIIGASSEGFSSAQACKKNIELLGVVMLELANDAVENAE